MMPSNAFIKAECSDYEDQITCVVLSASNGIWSGGVVIYVENDQLSAWIDRLCDYDGTEDSTAALEQGAPRGKYAYYVSIVVSPSSTWGASKIGIHFADFAEMSDGKSCEFDIRCDPSQVRELGKLLRQAHQGREAITWEIPKYSSSGSWFP